MATFFDNLYEAFGIDFNPKVSLRDTANIFEIDRTDVAEVTVQAMGGVNDADISPAMMNSKLEDAELIQTYRQLAKSSEIDQALQEIRNEIFIFDVPGKRAFEVAFLDEDGSPEEAVREKISEVFHEVYNIMDFKNKGIIYFDSWYIDSRLILHKVVDNKKLKNGISSVNIINPLNIRKVRYLPRPNPDGTIDKNKIVEKYMYSTNFGMNNRKDPNFSFNQITELSVGMQISGMPIEPDSIVDVDSGKFDLDAGRYTGYLQKAIQPFNSLKMMEDSMVIFRVVRAPMRRAFYIDTSGLPKNKAEQYVKDQMRQFRTKMAFDTRTGQMADKRNIQSMVEDFWLPRKDGQSGTEIKNLEGQDSNQILEEVSYYRDKLWRALNVPLSRFSDEPSPINIGGGDSQSIQRDEYRFKKFIDALRAQFIQVVEEVLRTQLILTKVISPDDWEEISKYMYWEYTEDNTFVEMKESDILNSRLAILAQLTQQPAEGNFFSRLWIQKNVLKLTDDQIAEEEKQIEKEAEKTQQKTMQNMQQGLNANGEPQ